MLRCGRLLRHGRHFRTGCSRMKNHMMPPTRNTYNPKNQARLLSTPMLDIASPHEVQTTKVTSAATVLCLGWSRDCPPHLPQRYGFRRVMESSRSGFAKLWQYGQVFIMRNRSQPPASVADEAWFVFEPNVLLRLAEPSGNRIAIPALPAVDWFGDKCS